MLTMTFKKITHRYQCLYVLVRFQSRLAFACVFAQLPMVGLAHKGAHIILVLGHLSAVSGGENLWMLEQMGAMPL